MKYTITQEGKTTEIEADGINHVNCGISLYKNDAVGKNVPAGLHNTPENRQREVAFFNEVLSVVGEDAKPKQD